MRSVPAVTWIGLKLSTLAARAGPAWSITGTGFALGFVSGTQTSWRGGRQR